MTSTNFSYSLTRPTGPRLGLIALQADETIEGDMRRLLPEDAEYMVSRVASGENVTTDTLAAMEGNLAAAAALFPVGAEFDVIGYGCTSGTAQIGVAQVDDAIRSAATATSVTQPLSSLVAACRHLSISRLAVLSPYVASVSERLRIALTQDAIETPVFGSFDVATEALVVRISERSIIDAAIELTVGSDVDALFISCTNLRALSVIAPLEERLGKPVLTSNQVLAWHMMQIARLPAPKCAPGQLFAG